MPSRTFGPYRLIKIIGEGEFGKVKLAISETGQEVAIKLVRKSSLDNDGKHSKLMREMSLLQSLDHPNIVKLIKVIETELYYGMILDYASGGELFEYILARQYLKESIAVRFFAQLISGVSYLHSLNIVHRDLKLENLLLDADNNVIITDFGFANRSAKDKFLSTSCGSPCYAAPELVMNDSYKGESADIWSCGVILYAMLCGYLPYDDDPANPEGDNINLLYKYILSTRLEFPAHLSNEAKHLISRLLVPDPKQRAVMDEIKNHSWLAPARDIIHQELDQLSNQFNHNLTFHSHASSSDPIYIQKSAIHRPHISAVDFEFPKSPSSFEHSPITTDFPPRKSSFKSTLQTSAVPLPEAFVFNKEEYPHSKSIDENRLPIGGTLGRFKIEEASDQVYRKSFDVRPSAKKKVTYDANVLDIPSQERDFGPRHSIGGRSTYSLDKNNLIYRIRYHKGPIDLNAISSKDPFLLLEEIQLALIQLGFDVEPDRDYPFRLKVLKKMPTQENNTSILKRISTLPKFLMERLRYGRSWNKGYDGMGEFYCEENSFHGQYTLYDNHPNISSETPYPLFANVTKELKFNVEIQMIKHLKGLFVVEFKRRKGNIWAFKALYQDTITKLPLNSGNLF